MGTSGQLILFQAQEGAGGAVLLGRNGQARKILSVSACTQAASRAAHWPVQDNGRSIAYVASGHTNSILRPGDLGYPGYSGLMWGHPNMTVYARVHPISRGPADRMIMGIITPRINVPITARFHDSPTLVNHPSMPSGSPALALCWQVLHCSRKGLCLDGAGRGFRQHHLFRWALVLLACFALAPAAAQMPFGDAGRDANPNAPTFVAATPKAADALTTDAPLLPVPQHFVTPGQVALLGTGTIDATPAINAGLASGPLMVPCGLYSLHEPLAPINRDGAALIGISRACVTLRADFSAGDAITLGAVGGPGLGPKFTELRGFTLLAGVPHTSGTGIRVGTHYDASIDEVNISGSWGDGITVHGGGAGAITRIHHFWMGAITGSSGGACIRLVAFAIDTYISQGNTNQCVNALRVDSASGVYADHLDFYGSTGTGILFDPSAAAGDRVFGAWLTTVLSDTSTLDNLLLGGEGALSDLHLVNSWFSSSRTGHGIAVTNPALNALDLVTTKILNNHSDGIKILAGKHISIGAGSRVEMNSRGGAGLGNGITIGPAASYITIMGAASGPGGTIEAQDVVNQQAYGLAVAAGVTHLIVQGNQMDGNITGGCSIEATGATVHVAGNDGSGC